MWEKISHWILTQGTFAGVEYLQKPDGLYFNLTILKKEKGVAKIIVTQNDIASIEALKTYLDDKIPVYLVINVNGMLHRKLDYIPNSKIEVLQAVFPSANPADFLVQQTPTKDNALVSIIRKETTREIIGQLNKNQVEVIAIFAGNFVLQSLLPALGDITALSLFNFHLQVEQQKIVGFSKESYPAIDLPVGNQTVQSTELPALNMAFLGMTQNAIVPLDLEETQKNSVDFIYKRLFYFTSIAVLLLFFIALLINYFLFEQYSAKVKELQIELTQQQNLLIQRDTLAKQLEQKIAVLGNKMNIGNSKTSFYADQIAASLPSSMQLININIYPIIETTIYDQEAKIPRYETNKIIIKGYCQASVFYNDWKRNIQSLSWVKSIQNISYQNDQNGTGIFELEITLQ